MRELSLDEYRGVLADCMPPRPVQIDAFIEYVCRKHSWYKHLPTSFPGARMGFFLDPNAGTDRIVHDDGRVERRWRGLGDSHAHHSWLPTLEYRTRFSLLAMTSVAAPSFEVSGGGQRQEIDELPRIDVDGEACAVPGEVLAASAVEVTGVIFPFASHRGLLPIYHRQLRRELERRDDGQPAYWPEESGGAGVLPELLRLLDSPSLEYSDRAEALMTREQLRQHAAMRASIDRMLALVSRP